MTKNEYLQSLIGVPKHMITQDDVIQYAAILKEHNPDEYEINLGMADTFAIVDELMDAYFDKTNGVFDALKTHTDILKTHISNSFESVLFDDIDTLSEANDDAIESQLLDRDEAAAINRGNGL